MVRIKKSWLTLMLLFTLAAPMSARADYYWYGGQGGSEPGDPDNPTPYQPWYRAQDGRGGDGVRQNQPWRSDSALRRYLILLSGLRSFYLRF
jgi:hypothetical protein